MTSRALRWEVADGPHVDSLRRVVLVPLLSLLVVPAVSNLVGGIRHDLTRLQAAASAGLFATVIFVAFVSRHLEVRREQLITLHVSVALAWYLAGQIDDPFFLIAAQWASTTVALLLGSSLRRSRDVFIGAVVLDSVALGASFLAGFPRDQLFGTLCYLSTLPIAAYGFTQLLYRSAVAADQSTFGTSVAHDSLARASRLREMDREFGRLIHDDVISALRVVTEQTHSPTETADFCRRALSVVRSATSSSHLRHREGVEIAIVAAGQRAGIAVTPRVRVKATPVLIPENVLSAFQKAIGEALRNVSRHAGVGEAEVDVSLTRQSLLVTVADHGSGFDTTKAGFGIKQSILERLKTVGADARVISAADHGTTVWMRWEMSDPVPPDSAPMAHDLSERIGIPLLLAQVALSSFYAPFSAQPVVSYTVLAVATLLSIVTISALQQRSVTPRGTLAITASACVLIAAQLSVAQPGAMGDYRSWVLSLTSVSLMLIAFTQPARWLILLAGGPALVVGTYLISTDQFTSRTVLSVCSSLGAILFGAVVGYRARKARNHVDEAIAQWSEAHDLMHKERLLLQAGESQWRHFNQAVIPFLEGVSTGDIDVDSAQAQSQAELLALSARDEIYAPGFCDEELRGAIERFRSGGGVFVLRPGIEPKSGEDGLNHLLVQIMQALPECRVTVSADEGAFRIAIVPGIDPSIATPWDDNPTVTAVSRSANSVVLRMPTGSAR